MKDLKIYCSSLNYYPVIDKLPSYIQPIGLGQNKFPPQWLDEKKGKNISSLNKFYGEFTGFYFIWKNLMHKINYSDLIGFCHYRKLWMNNNYEKKNKLSLNSIYSSLLKYKNLDLQKYDAIQVRPIIFKNKNLFSDFQNVHKCDALIKSVEFFKDKDKKNSFINHLEGNTLYPLNMFITKKEIFEEYCFNLFPWLENCYNYCNDNNLLKGYNIRLPAFLGERFTSFWFSKIKLKSTLNYARLGSFFLNSRLNKYFNTLKIPLTARMYPTIHKF